jgi:sigma-70-like protein
MSNLSADHRAILDLVYYEEKSIQDSALVLGIPATTVKIRMFYARRSWLSWSGGVTKGRNENRAQPLIQRILKTGLTSLGVRSFEMCKGLGDAPSSRGLSLSG